MTPRQQVEGMAMHFLAHVGEDEVGVINSEEQMAAALIYIDLEKQGLVVHRKGPNGPIYRLTDAGKARTQVDQDEVLKLARAS